MLWSWCTSLSCNNVYHQCTSEGFIEFKNKHTVRTPPPDKWGKEPSSRLNAPCPKTFFFWLHTCSHSPGVPGCVGAAPCPGAQGEPAACVVRRVSHGPGLGWSDAGGTDLHPWVPHTGDSTLSHQHTATSSTKQSQGHRGRADRPKQGKARRTRKRYHRTRHKETRRHDGTGSLCQVHSPKI